MFPKSHAVILRSTTHVAQRLAQLFRRRELLHATHVLWPTLVALTFASVAHAQGTMDFSGAQTLMGTFNGRFAYVSVSRASDDAQVFTNDASNLAQRLCREVSKTSAVTFSNTEFRIPTLTPEQVKTTRKTPAAGLELAL